MILFNKSIDVFTDVFQMAPGGNYFNLVVFRPGRGASEFRRLPAPSHANAIRKVAPHFYQRVWIHRYYIGKYQSRREYVKKYSGVTKNGEFEKKLYALLALFLFVRN